MEGTVSIKKHSISSPRLVSFYSGHGRMSPFTSKLHYDKLLPSFQRRFWHLLLLLPRQQILLIQTATMSLCKAKTSLPSRIQTTDLSTTHIRIIISTRIPILTQSLRRSQTQANGYTMTLLLSTSTMSLSD